MVWKSVDIRHQVMTPSRICRVVLMGLFMMCKTGDCRNCDWSDELGHPDLFSVSGVFGTSVDTQFIMTDGEYVSPCCGLVTEWAVYGVATGNVVFQVWRPDNGLFTAELIGENAVAVTNISEFTYQVPASEQIPIQENDVIGWHTSGTEIVEFTFGFSENLFNFIEDISQPAIGDAVTLSTQVPYRTYAIHAKLSSVPAPTLTNLDSSLHLLVSSIDTVTPVFTVTSSSASTTFTLENITPSSHFTISPSTGEVTATTTSVLGVTYVLNVSASENCSDSSLGVLTIVLTDTFPVWSNLNATTAVSKNSISTITPVFTAVATISAANESVSYSLQSISPASHFSVDVTSGDVTATTSEVDEATYTLVIRASNAYGNGVDEALTINVVNSAPQIDSLPDVVDVSETSTDETLLHVVNVTDADNDVITCNMTSTPSGPFTTKYATSDGVFITELYLQANPSLNYSAVDAYTLTVTCTDGVASDANTLYVYVTPNNVPIITNLPNTTTILSSTPTSTAIFQVTSTDVENDATFYKLVCLAASPCPFTIYSDGSVLLTTSIAIANNYSYQLDISVRDDLSTSGYHPLTVFVTDLNSQPQLNNLPATIQINEDTLVGSPVFDVSVYDEDGDNLHYFTAHFTPASGSTVFQLNSTSGQVILAASLDYLTQDHDYTVTIRVSDYQTTSTPEELSIEVVDVNQPPILYQTNYGVEVDEGPAGTESSDPGFNVFDPDSDNLTYSWGGGNDTAGFSINTTNGIVSFSVDFDADDTSTDTQYVWLVVISDTGGLSTTATMTLSILDVNDNVPSLSSSNYAASISSNAQVGTSILRVQSSDADRKDENRELEYSIHSTSLFIIDDNGTIFVYDDLSGVADTVQTFWIRVKNPATSGNDQASISVSIEEGSDHQGFLDDGANIAWVSLTCVVGTLVVAGLVYLSYHGYHRWISTTTSSRTVTQVAPYDTKMATPNDRSASLVTRDTVVTPRDVNLYNGFKEPWQGWSSRDWQVY